MKKFFSILTIILFCFLMKKQVFAYTFPEDFNFQAAKNHLISNGVQYNTDKYYLSRYPYTGDEAIYRGKYTQNFSWSSSVYPIAFYANENHTSLDIYLLSDGPFYSQRYNLDDTYNSNKSHTGSTVFGAIETTPTNNTIINSDFTYFYNQMGYSFYIAYNGVTYDINNYFYNFPIYNTLDDFFQALYEHNYDLPIFPPGDDTLTGDLPFLTYTLNNKTVMTLNNGLPSGQVKEVFNWDYTEKDPYASSPQNYSFDIMAYANFFTPTENNPTNAEYFDRTNFDLNETNRVYLTKGGQNIALNEFSFLYRDIGKSVYSLSGKQFLDDSVSSMQEGYILGIRTANNERTQFSWWKLFIVQSGGTVFSTGKVMKPDGTIVDSNAENSNDNIGSTTTGNGGGNYSSNSNTTAGSDTTGTVYTQGTNNLNVGTLFSTLQELVNQIGNIPNILAQLLTFLPAWLISILVISIGLFVTIGIVKLIAR